MRTRATRGLHVALILTALIASLLAAAVSGASADGETGSISGTVTDDRGKPLAGVAVTVYTYDAPDSPYAPYEQSLSVFTDDLGAYTAPVTAGYHVLSFSLEDYAVEFYNDSLDFLKTHRVPVQAGQHVSGINAVLQLPQPTVVPQTVLRIHEVGGSGLQKQIAIRNVSWITNSPIPASELTFTYQWGHVTGTGAARTLTPIPGATGAVYTTSRVDFSRHLGVVMTASHPKLRSQSALIADHTSPRLLSRIKITSARSPRKKTIEIKVKATTDGLPYATGTVRASCRYRGGHSMTSRSFTLKQGKATLRFKAQGITKKGKRAYCAVTHPGTAESSTAMDPMTPKSPRAFSMKLK